MTLKAWRRKLRNNKKIIYAKFYFTKTNYMVVKIEPELLTRYIQKMNGEFELQKFSLDSESIRGFFEYRGFYQYSHEPHLLTKEEFEREAVRFMLES